MSERPDPPTSTRRRLLASGVGVAAALAGCTAPGNRPTPRPPEARVTVRLRNRDAVRREYRVVVRGGDDVTAEFSGVLPADQERRVEMVATLRARGDQHEVVVETEGGRRGRTWDPTECRDLVVDAYVEGGEPGFTTACPDG